MQHRVSKNKAISQEISYLKLSYQKWLRIFSETPFPVSETETDTILIRFVWKHQENVFELSHQFGNDRSDFGNVFWVSIYFATSKKVICWGNKACFFCHLSWRAQQSTHSYCIFLLSFDKV